MESYGINARFEHYIYTLNSTDYNWGEKTNEEIETFVFENFDIDIITYLGGGNLDILKEHILIDEEIYKKSLKLREKFLSLQHTEYWSIKAVREAKVWKEIVDDSNEIKRLMVDFYKKIWEMDIKLENDKLIFPDNFEF